ncbi:probable inactive protein kinase DDB_G0270444 [Drosophila santomea]|uniref:probable inactive protein kinase DDB_G0270444 n=1 Tax=Drosophila santomea TaxID=129105 RepID=UPI001952CD42|nr:probable inactive protein kinase DDB_G0270444 [Drosophila santomea]
MSKNLELQVPKHIRSQKKKQPTNHLKTLAKNLPLRQLREIPKMAPHATLQNETILKPSELSKYPQNQPHSNRLYKYSVTRGSSAEFKENGSSRSLLKHPWNQSHNGVHKSQCPQDVQAQSPKNFTQSQEPEAAGAPHARQEHNAYLEKWRSNWNHTMGYIKKVVLPENPKVNPQGNLKKEVSHPLSMPSTCQPPMGIKYTQEQSVPLDLSGEKSGPPSDTKSNSDGPTMDDKETAKHANKSHPLNSDHQYAMVKQSPDRNVWDMDSFNDMVASEVELRESPSGIFHSSAVEIGTICSQLTGTDVPAHVEVPIADGCYVLGTENGQPETPVPSSEFTDGLKYQELMSQDTDAEAITFDENSNEQSKAQQQPPESMAWHMDASSAGQRNQEEFKTEEHFDINVEPELPEQIMSCASTAGQNNQEAAYCENTSKNPDPEISTYDENIDLLEQLHATIPPPEYIASQQEVEAMLYGDMDSDDDPEAYSSIFDYLGLETQQMPEKQPGTDDSQLLTTSSEDKEYIDVVACNATHPVLDSEPMTEEVIEVKQVEEEVEQVDEQVEQVEDEVEQVEEEVEEVEEEEVEEEVEEVEEEMEEFEEEVEEVEEEMEEFEEEVEEFEEEMEEDEEEVEEFEEEMEEDEEEVEEIEEEVDEVEELDEEMGEEEEFYDDGSDWTQETESEDDDSD